MNPRTCLYPHHDDPKDFDVMIHSILEDIKYDDTRQQALERVFSKTDPAHQHNRYVQQQANITTMETQKYLQSHLSRSYTAFPWFVQVNGM